MRTNSWHWHCTVEGCSCCGAGYPSESRAASAARMHLEQGHPRINNTTKRGN